MFIIRFIRSDNLPCEEYYYNCIHDALFHLLLFANNESGLFKRIYLLKNSDKSTSVLAFF